MQICLPRHGWPSQSQSAWLTVNGVLWSPMRKVLWLTALAVFADSRAIGDLDQSHRARRLRARRPAPAPSPTHVPSPSMKLLPAGATDVGSQLRDVSETLSEALEAEKVLTPRYNYSYVPKNPPHAPDISPTDPGEYFESLGGTVADMIDPISEDFPATAHRRVTCESACQACMIDSAENSGGVCSCYAECKKGACGDSPHIGWSNNKVSSPKEWWVAQCNVGEKHCETECVSSDFAAKVRGCESSKSLIACYEELRRVHREPSMDSRKNVMYCIREGMARCDKFMAPPTTKEWQCYDNEDHCMAQKDTLNYVIFQHPPSVWESTA